MTETKYCIDCRHYDGYGNCRQPTAVISLVTGQPAQVRASEMRGYAGACNKGGRLWAPMSDEQRQLQADLEAAKRLHQQDMEDQHARRVECERRKDEDESARLIAEMNVRAWEGAANTVPSMSEMGLSGWAESEPAPKRPWWRVWG